MILTTIATLLSVAGAVGPAPTEGRMIAELQRLSAGFERAAQNEAIEELESFYAENAWIKPPCDPLVQGRPAVLENWRALLARNQFSPSYTARDFDVAPDRRMAVERGKAQFLENVGGVPYGWNFTYSRIWHRTGSGKWLIVVDVASVADVCDDTE